MNEQKLYELKQAKELAQKRARSLSIFQLVSSALGIVCWAVGFLIAVVGAIVGLAISGAFNTLFA